MSSRTLTQEEYNTLFRHWKMQHGVLGKEYGGKQRHQVPIQSEERQRMYEILVNELIEKHGYTEEDLRSTLCFNSIVNTSVNLKSKNKKSWIEFAELDLNFVLDSLFQKIVEAPESKLKAVQSTRQATPTPERKKPADMGPDTPMLDRSKLSGFKPVSVIDESIDLVAELYGDDNE